MYEIRKVLSARTVLCFFSLLIAFGCTQEKLDFILPQIAVDACSESMVTISGKTLGGTANCQADFGEAEISVDAKKSLWIFNPSSVPLTIKRIGLQKADSPFRLVAQPGKVDAGQKVEVHLIHRAMREEQASDELLIESNAGNLKSSQTISVSVSARGVDKGLPSLELHTVGCDFGMVAVKQPVQCEVLLTNRGARSLMLDHVELLEHGSKNASGSPAFMFQGNFPSDGDVLRQGESAQLYVTFLPEQQGVFAGNVRVRSNDPMSPMQEAKLSGEGVLPPIAVCGIKKVNGTTYSSAKGIEPLDNVVVSAEGSHAEAPGASIRAYEWKIIKRPSGSTIEPHQRTQMETPFYFSNNAF